MKRLALALIALGSFCTPASAGADGLPLPVEGADDASVPSLDGPYRYAAVSNGDRTTVLQIVMDGGRIFRSRTIDGTFSVPLVAYDGTASGLPADGDTLVLIKPRAAFPRTTTDFVVLDTATLKPQRSVHLNGDFSFDAISPDGRRMYLIHYESPRNPLDYEVRAYDLERDRLVRDPIVDPDEPGERMAGFPMARKTSPDGRWAYTLYAGGDESFIHALDTKRLTAQCIDLDDVRPRDLYQLGLNLDPDSGELTVLEQGRPLAVVDPDTFEASRPPPEPVAADATAAGGSDDGTSWVGWAALGGGLALIAGLVAVLWRRRRPADGVDEAELERLVRVDASERDREPVH
jgi:hypothetical protein